MALSSQAGALTDQEIRRNFADLDAKLSTKVGWGLGTVASAATITIPDGVSAVNVTGSTNITSVAASAPGRIVTLIFADILVFTDGSNLKLAGNFTTSDDDTVTIVCDGTNWHECSRSTN